jgi:hypothetical protein
MTTSQLNTGNDPEQDAIEQAIADLLVGAYQPPGQGLGRVAYDFAYREATRLRDSVAEHIQRGASVPPADPLEQRVYLALYRALSGPATGVTQKLTPPATGVTERLSSPANANAQRRSARQRTCPFCGGTMLPVRVVSRGHEHRHNELEYVQMNKQRGFFMNTYDIDGYIEAKRCRGCGFLALFGIPKDEG